MIKSNFMELYNEFLSKNHKTVSIEDFTDFIEDRIVFYEQVSPKEFKRQYLRGRIATLLNVNDYYSYKLGEFVSLNIADLESLIKIVTNFDSDIKGRLRTRERIIKEIKEREACKGQMEMVFNGTDCVGLGEVRGIEDLLGD